MGPGRPAPSTRRALAVLAVALAIAAGAILLVAFVFTPPLGAPETEWEIAHELELQATAVTCERLFFADWDYECSYSHVPDGERITIRVRVDKNGIVARDDG